MDTHLVIHPSEFIIRCHTGLWMPVAVQIISEAVMHENPFCSLRRVMMHCFTLLLCRTCIIWHSRVPNSNYSSSNIDQWLIYKHDHMYGWGPYFHNWEKVSKTTILRYLPLISQIWDRTLWKCFPNETAWWSHPTCTTSTTSQKFDWYHVAWPDWQENSSPFKITDTICES